MKEVYVVTVVTFETVENVFVYEDEADAEEKLLSLAKSYYSDEVEFNTVDDVHNHDKNDYDEQYGIDVNMVVVEEKKSA